MRLALYAHYGARPSIARHVLYYVSKLAEMGFKVCFISNSPVAAASEDEVGPHCDRVIQRENVGFDFSMWQRGLAEYDLTEVDELLLTNSSVVGPLRPLEQLWSSPIIRECDFWGLTDNCVYSHHLQSYFLVFRRPLVQSECFGRFWASVLPYRDKEQVIRSYEVGLTRWVEQAGFRWAALFDQKRIWRRYLESRDPARKMVDWILRRKLPGRETVLFYPHLLIEAGVPFLKASLLRPGNGYWPPQAAWALLKAASLPKEVVEELDPNTLDGGRLRPERTIETAA